MKIFVVGNINSGKTYLVNKLRSIFPHYAILAIDEYRVKYSDGSKESEIKTRIHFAEDIIKYSNAIIEFSGGSTISSLFIDDLRKNSFIILEVKEALDVCLERIEDKDFNQTPYPHFNESLEDTIIRLDKEFLDNAININFKDKFLKKFVISSNQILEDLPLVQYENTIKIADYFINKCESLIAYGSLGRHDMSINSDIDLYLITQEKLTDIYRELLIIFPNGHFIVQKNQIDIFDGSHLIEITLVNDIQSIELYYMTSNILIPEKTMLIDNNNSIGKLTSIIKKYKFDFLGDFKFTLSRLDYYYRSLERLIKKNDHYKYFFHTNIVIHEYLKIKYFMQGKKELSYLPKNGFNYIDLQEFNQLLYIPKIDQIEHLKLVSRLIEDIILQAKSYLEEFETSDCL